MRSSVSFESIFILRPLFNNNAFYHFLKDTFCRKSSILYYFFTCGQRGSEQACAFVKYRQQQAAQAVYVYTKAGQRGDQLPASQMRVLNCHRQAEHGRRSGGAEQHVQPRSSLLRHSARRAQQIIQQSQAEPAAEKS
ncbi:MAG: hypothetical protein SO014_06900 [Candidatus Limivicinus sp.]|nr:hypothetical protein [Clostridiales bacterium]MDY3860345.1 hypothetical protein [Candidatus Limivicinus sp.]